MAVVARERKSGTVFYVVNLWLGKPAWERVGTHKRAAEQRDKAMKREIEAGTYSPPSTAKALTVRQFCEKWCSTRTNASAKEERRTLGLYVFNRSWLADERLDAIRHTEIDRWVAEMRSERKDNGDRRITDKTIANAFGILRQVYEEAVRTDIVVKNPCKLKRGELKRTPATERETYSIAELLVLVRHKAIPWPIRMMNALALFTGMRKGEVCGRRWKDLDASSGPLASLSVATQYDDRPLKTERPRLVPIHPELATMLEAWAKEGFELWTGRKPRPDDLIVPDVKNGVVKGFTRSTAHKAFVMYAELAGVRPRTMHATRHTFISLCRRGGARKDVLERITHNARGDIIDRYTHLDWLPLCEAVLCLTLDAHQETQRTSGIGGKFSGLALPSSGEQNAGITVASDSGTRLRPVVTNGTAAENKPSQNPRQVSRQLSADDLRAGIRVRRRKLLALDAHDPDAARPGLDLLGTYEAVLARDQAATLRGLARTVRALGLGQRDGTYTRRTGGRP